MTDMVELRDRLRAATGPDRELDLAIATALVPDVIVGRQRDDDSGADPYTYWKYTASVDAALALVERMLPGWRYRLWKHVSGKFGADIFPSDGGTISRAHDAATQALAILAAILDALRSHNAGERR